MSLELIGVGFGRTGTLSTYVALNELGLPCYHMAEVFINAENKSHLDFWLKVAEGPSGVQHDWDSIFKKYKATVDNPGCCVWKELVEAYPNAKVLLTLHPKGPKEWYESTLNTIYTTESKWYFKVLSFFVPNMKKQVTMMSKLIWQKSHRGTMKDMKAALARYEEHIEEVKSVVPSDRLLVFSVTQGWKPLCDFLNLPVPDKPYPRVNDRDETRKRFAKNLIPAVGILIIVVSVILSIVYGIVKLLG